MTLDHQGQPIDIGAIVLVVNGNYVSKVGIVRTIRADPERSCGVEDLNPRMLIFKFAKNLRVISDPHLIVDQGL
jgi:hypothetical protein